MSTIKNLLPEKNSANNLLANETNRVSRKEIIIITALAIVFVVVLFGALWDIYGRNLLCSCNCNTQTNQSAGDIRPGEGGLTTTPKVKNGNNTSTPPTKNGNNQPPKADANIDTSLYQTCLSNAKDLGDSKDCCDCLSGDASLHKACRDAAANYDFSKNTTFKTLEIPTTLGQNGDYSACTASGNQQQCKQCCENSGKFVCGDFRFCRTACDNLSQ